ncbi:acetoacetate decarboxylase family protein [Nocardioides fonticola]|uniref:Acetoacetate decarboxylase family protein n=1 Tax=Nocardioides fonticola TaxID=450363 RepID=A0ABP7XDI4_9ACTN
MTQPAYPPTPWRMRAQLWMSLFRVPHPVDDLRPAGVYGVAFVRYEEGSPLTYHELLAGRMVDTGEHGRRVTITDIWVDSPASVAGGRALWAIPKELCTFAETEQRGRLRSRASWTASLAGRPIATARFGDVSAAMPRTPFRGETWQPAIDDHAAPVLGALTGSAKAGPCRSSWSFAPDGPLGWLDGARRLASFRNADVRMDVS